MQPQPEQSEPVDDERLLPDSEEEVEEPSEQQQPADEAGDSKPETEQHEQQQEPAAAHSKGKQLQPKAAVLKPSSDVAPRWRHVHILYSGWLVVYELSSQDYMRFSWATQLFTTKRPSRSIAALRQVLAGIPAQLRAEPADSARKWKDLEALQSARSALSFFNSNLYEAKYDHGVTVDSVLAATRQSHTGQLLSAAAQEQEAPLLPLARRVWPCSLRVQVPDRAGRARLFQVQQRRFSCQDAHHACRHCKLPAELPQHAAGAAACAADQQARDSRGQPTNTAAVNASSHQRF
eukprot:GHRQ01002433.1.p1 GENE.GHRQ01002433.1~~GHRQ01002433.1.p1  ORF type:complete len:292 (+),score=79.23 GHRQ01002433.1:1906-2781(+)